MKLNKRSCFAEIHGTYFEVPDRTKWIFIDPVCRLFAVMSEEKPTPVESCPVPLWHYNGDAVYIGMVRLFNMDNWRDMVFDVRGKLFTRDEAISGQVRIALNYVEEMLRNSDSIGGAYCAQLVKGVTEKLVNQHIENKP